MRFLSALLLCAAGIGAASTVAADDVVRDARFICSRPLRTAVAGATGASAASRRRVPAWNPTPCSLASTGAAES